jgi:hypothetical protein
MGKIKDITGQKFGTLTALHITDKPQNIKDRHTYWLCKCDCGKEIVCCGKHLRLGRINSCGCVKKERIKNLNLTHGMTKHRLHIIWNGIKQRCLNTRSHAYKSYGARGITICPEWKNDFMSFYNWAINHNYSDDLTIDRINVNGNYEPSNCRWATNKEQINNKRQTIYIEYNGKKQCLSYWADELGLESRLLYNRIHKLKWSVEKAFTTPKVGV